MPTETDTLNYNHLLPPWHDAGLPPDPGLALESPDRRDGRIYHYTPDLKLAVEVALATGRPLLLRGRPGSGKSSLAAYVARNLNWRYYEQVVTARTQARDLLYGFDLVRRLADAQLRPAARGGKPALNDYDYIQPGVLWWVFDRDSALRRGAPPGREPATPAEEPDRELNAGREPDHAVVLIDEIDKADPQVPNDLLVPLGSMHFRVEETGTRVSRPQHSPAAPGPAHHSRYLIIITTNEERELAPAFLRRCVVHTLEAPDRERLVEIARLHFKGPQGALDPDETRLCQAIAEQLLNLEDSADTLAIQPPSTAEYLDAVRACLTLGIRHGSPAWQRIEGLTLHKHRSLENLE